MATNITPDVTFSQGWYNGPHGKETLCEKCYRRQLRDKILEKEHAQCLGVGCGKSFRIDCLLDVVACLSRVRPLILRARYKIQHVMALGSPWTGHTLQEVLPAILCQEHVKRK